MSTQTNDIFSKLELECNLEKENKELKELVSTLNSKIKDMEQKELDRTKSNPEAQSVVIYNNSSGAYLMCEEWQKEQFDSSTYVIGAGNTSWGYGLNFKSIAGLYTQLFRLGFKFQHKSEHYYTSNGVRLPTEIWIRGV